MGLLQEKERQSDTVRLFNIEKLVTSRFEQLDDWALGTVRICNATVSLRDLSLHD